MYCSIHQHSHTTIVIIQVAGMSFQNKIVVQCRRVHKVIQTLNIRNLFFKIVQAASWQQRLWKLKTNKIIDTKNSHAISITSKSQTFWLSNAEFSLIKSSVKNVSVQIGWVWGLGWVFVNRRWLYMCVFSGLSSESCADVVGQPHYGHIRFAGSRHWAANRGTAAQEPVRPQETANFPNHDEKHPGTRCLPADHNLHPALCWFVNTPRLLFKADCAFEFRATNPHYSPS